MGLTSKLIVLLAVHLTGTLAWISLTDRPILSLKFLHYSIAEPSACEKQPRAVYDGRTAATTPRTRRSLLAVAALTIPGPFSYANAVGTFKDMADAAFARAMASESAMVCRTMSTGTRFFSTNCYR
jgi:hypothetical protein